jgi:17beta-estradiol 17-dehydrogenase / very-long-chain 3-oxoacyl-CoA reductase
MVDFWDVLVCIGAWYVATYLYAIFIVPRPLSRFLCAGKESSWAIVTGGSEGIGYAIAEELAGLGYNICLISRNLAKLEQAASSITKLHDVKVKTISHDFNSTTP